MKYVHISQEQMSEAMRKYGEAAAEFQAEPSTAGLK